MPNARQFAHRFQPMCCVVIMLALSLVVAPCANAQRDGGGLPPETVQADVSTRTVGITSSFTGTEIIVFGAIANAREPKSDEDEYDVVVIVEGVGSKVVARRKSNVGGIWVNTEARNFRHIPESGSDNIHGIFVSPESWPGHTAHRRTSRETDAGDG